jgi:pyruvate dehydrogenase E1 component alpha subunit
VNQAIAAKDLLALAAAYGIPSTRVDGSDVLAVRAATMAAVERARSGGGPSFVECQTYRFEGHYFGEPQMYRSREEVEEARRSRDPIARLEAVLEAEYGVDVEELHTLEAEASEVIREALEFAQESPEPLPETLREYVYV